MPSDAPSSSSSSSAPSTADLPIQEATLDLIRWFIPILHRLPRLHRYGLGDRLVANLYELLEQLAGTPHKWQAAGIFLGAGRLADQHQSGPGIAAAEHHLLAPLRQAAAAAGGAGRPQALQAEIGGGGPRAHGFMASHGLIATHGGIAIGIQAIPLLHRWVYSPGQRGSILAASPWLGQTP